MASAADDAAAQRRRPRRAARRRPPSTADRWRAAATMRSVASGASAAARSACSTLSRSVGAGSSGTDGGAARLAIRLRSKFLHAGRRPRLRDHVVEQRRHAARRPRRGSRSAPPPSCVTFWRASAAIAILRCRILRQRDVGQRDRDGVRSSSAKSSGPRVAA